MDLLERIETVDPNDKAALDEVETKHTDEMICPYCFYEDQDSWEHNDDDGQTINCGECGEEFKLHVYFDVTYSTYKT